MFNKQLIGKNGEKVAAKYLEQIEYNILETNFRCKYGEIDIIAENNNEKVFIEVKTRTSCKYGSPAEAVNKIKRTHIKNVAEYYLYKNNLLNKFIRFDVIEVYFIKNKYMIRHLKNIEI